MPSQGPIAAGVLARVRGDVNGALDRLEASVRLARASNADRLVADGLMELANAYAASDDFVRSEALRTEVLIATAGSAISEASPAA